MSTEPLHHESSALRPAIEFDPATVPALLRDRDRWICWRLVPAEPKPRKVPVDPRTGHTADPHDPAVWVGFDEAVRRCRQIPGCAGVGFVFVEGDGITGIDLDDCVVDGVLTPQAADVVRTFASYAEFSPSGTGVKIFIFGRKPTDACRCKGVEGFGEVEVYHKKRYFTVTGRRLEGVPPDLEPRQDQLNALCERLWPLTRPEAVSHNSTSTGFDSDDDVLIERAGEAKHGGRFRALWAGDVSLHGDDRSGADLALCNYLAFWTGRDPARMDRLFRRSSLFRPKWDERRGDRTYGQMTIDRAIADCTDVYSPRTTPPERRDDATGADDEHGGDGATVPLGHRDPVTGRLVLSPRRTLPTARAYVREFNQHHDGRTLHGYGGLLMEWRGNRYCEVEEESIKQRLQPWLHSALRYVVNRQTGELELVDFESNPTTVKQALDTIRSFVHLPSATASPSWLHDGAGTERPPAGEILPCKSLNLHIPTGRVLSATPSLFTINALDFDYDPEPEPSERWIKFLEQLFGDDLESVRLLQEWMGYCLTGDTSQQKMLLLVGPRRSGKGTIGRILTRLVGAGNVVGPTTGSLAGVFGLQPLIGKSLAIVSDARFSGENVATVIERLLCISGEDTMTIDRKFLGSVSMKLATRFVFLTNELPRLNDASTALAGRFLVLRLNTSFYGVEDPTLTEQLVAELPGILLWAIEGWKRLRARGRFVQPESSNDAIRDMEDLGSPVGAFIRDRCTVGVGHRAWVDDLYNAWKDWCEQDGRNAVSTKQAFGRDLMAAAPGVARRRGTGMVAFYEGISLRTEVAI